jgi:hypothetical protein
VSRCSTEISSSGTRGFASSSRKIQWESYHGLQVQPPLHSWNLIPTTYSLDIFISKHETCICVSRCSTEISSSGTRGFASSSRKIQWDWLPGRCLSYHGLQVQPPLHSWNLIPTTYSLDIFISKHETRSSSVSSRFNFPSRDLISRTASRFSSRG